MANGWRPRATVAMASFALIPLWMMAASTLKGTGGSDELGIAMVAQCLIFAVGFGAISGVGRGSQASRMASKVVFVWFFLLVTVALSLFWLSEQRLRSEQFIGRKVPRNESCPRRQHLIRLSLHDGSGNEVVD